MTRSVLIERLHERWLRRRSADKLLDELVPRPPAKIRPEDIEALVHDEDSTSKRDSD